MANHSNNNDKDIISLALTSIRSQVMYDLQIGRTPYNHKYHDLALMNVRNWWRDRNSKIFKFRSTDMTPELRDLLKRLTPEIQKEVDNLILDCHKKFKTMEINETTARAVISSLLDELGVTGYSFRPQTYRIKVHIPLSYGRNLVIPIKYKELQIKMESIATTIQHAREMNEIFGRDLCII